MDRFRILGPTRLHGCVRAGGAKNAALPAMAASLLTDQPLTLRRVPWVRDLSTMRQLLEHLGVDSTAENGQLVLRPNTSNGVSDAPYELVKKMRASVLTLGPLLARRGRARVSLPGGCAIGVRPIDQHLAGLEALGAKVALEHGYVLAEASRLRGARVQLAMPTVTGTENLLMAACLADGESELLGCAREPEVVDLAELLAAMGATIEGAGTPTIHVQGVDSLGGTTHTIVADRIEGGTYLLAAAVTGGDVTLEGAVPEHLAPLLAVLDDCGVNVSIDGDRIRVAALDRLRPRDVATAPHPGFPTDLQAQFMAAMTQATGRSTISETVFENRFQHVAELARMGADIAVDGSLARVHGPRSLSGAHVMATDLRASACLVLAAMAATGETLVHRIYHLDRGYERMEVKLRELGAAVERQAGPPTP